jgi:hypothetical protein
MAMHARVLMRSDLLESGTYYTAKDVSGVGTALSIVLSVVALGFSIFVFTDSRRRDRRDVFLKITEYLTSDDIQRGRYILFDRVADEPSIERLTDDEYRDVHRAVNAFNILGLYVKNGYVSERDVLDTWTIPVYRARRAAQPLIAFRQRTHGYVAWPYFEALAKKCEKDLEGKDEKVEFMVWHRQSPGATSESIHTSSDPPKGSPRPEE